VYIPNIIHVAFFENRSREGLAYSFGHTAENAWILGHWCDVLQMFCDLLVGNFVGAGSSVFTSVPISYPSSCLRISDTGYIKNLTGIALANNFFFFLKR
jgi:hypothetical protein